MQVFVVSLITAGIMLLGTVLCYFPFDSVVSPKTKKLLFGIYGGGFLLTMLICYGLFSDSGLQRVIEFIRKSAVAYAAVTALVNLVLIPKHRREHLFVLGVVLMCFTLLMPVPTFVCSLLTEIEENAAVFLWLIIYIGVLAIASPLLKRLLERTIEPFLLVESGNYWNTVCFIPAAYYGATMLFTSAANNVEPGIKLVSSMLSGAMIVLICISVTWDHKRLEDKVDMEKQLEAQKLHYLEMQVKVQEARRTRHDYKHHLTVIRHFMDRDDKAGLYDYCDELLGHVEEKMTVPYTGNAAADGVVFYYMQKADKEKISFSHTGSIRSTGISNTDLCALLGNALDNACAGCRTLPENRSIKLIAQSEEHLLTVVVHNTFDGKIRETKEGLLSHKRENQVGVGIHSMQSICEKYGGCLKYEWDQETFTLMFMLPLKEEK